MSREKKLVTNTLIYALANFLSRFLGFVLLPFYTYYLSTTDYGYFDLVSNTLAVVMPIVTFQINDGLYRYLLDSQDDNEKSKFISNAFFLLFRNLIIGNLIFILVSYKINISQKYLVLSMLNSSIVSSMWLQISRGLKKNSEYAVSGIIATFFMLVSNIVLIIYFNKKVEALLISSIIGSLVTFLYIEYRVGVRRYIQISIINKKIMNDLIKYSLPFIPNVISWWVMNVSDRFIISYYMGVETNGIYAIANRFPALLLLVNTIFGLAWQESAITENDSNDKDYFYSRMFNAYMILQITFCIIILPSTKLIFNSMIGENFKTAWLYIPLLYIAAILFGFSTFYGVGYQTSKETKGLFYTSVLGAILNILVNFILIPIIGLQAASLSTMLAFLAMWIARVKTTRKYYIITIDKQKFCVLSAILVVYTMLYYINNSYINYIMVAISLVIFYFFNKRFINSVIMMIKYKFKSLLSLL